MTKALRGRSTALFTLLATTLTTAAASPGHAAARTGCPATDRDATSASVHTISGSVRCLVNAERAAHGLTPLASSPRLRRAATAHSRDMVVRRYFDHVGPGGSTLVERARRAGYRGPSLREAIAWGSNQLSTPAAIVDEWMHSPPHRAVILSRHFTDLGVGVAIGCPVSGAANGAVYTLDVGRR